MQDLTPTIRVNLSLPEILDSTERLENAGDEVYALKDRLVSKHSSLIGMLAGIPIKLLLKLKPSFHGGKAVLGKTTVFPEVQRLLHPFFFMIQLDKEFWEKNVGKREALLFHELCHAGIDDEGRPHIIPHDFEEFYSVVKLYGDWADEGLTQLSLFDSPSTESK